MTMVLLLGRSLCVWSSNLSLSDFPLGSRPVLSEEEGGSNFGILLSTLEVKRPS